MMPIRRSPVSHFGKKECENPNFSEILSDSDNTLPLHQSEVEASHHRYLETEWFSLYATFSSPTLFAYPSINNVHPFEAILRVRVSQGVPIDSQLAYLHKR
jgi:hypothetical protein